MSDGPIQKRKLGDEVRLRLLSLIACGALRPGDALPSERALMDSLKVGRPAIREAMQSLEQTGLIQIRHGERARVAEPSVGRMVDQVTETMKHLLVQSAASLENLKEVRLTFEVEMARVAARRHGAIISAIQSGNPDRAAEAMADHLNRANDLYRRPERGV